MTCKETAIALVNERRNKVVTAFKELTVEQLTSFQAYLAAFENAVRNEMVKKR